MLLVLHQGAIGDFMLTLSVVGALREHLGSPPVEVIASAPSARWAAKHGLIDTSHSPESVGLHTLFALDTPPDDHLARLLRRATVVASFLGNPSEPIHARLATSTSARVISVDPRPHPATLSKGTHITNQWAVDIRTQGVSIGPPLAIRAKGSGVFKALSRGSNHRTRSEAALGGSIQGLPPPSRAILLHPGSGGRHKCWPIERFVELADTSARDGVEITWMLGPAEYERTPDCCAVVANRAKMKQERLIHTDDLTAAADQIHVFDLFIGNDGGMSHVAAATSIPTLIIYTTTDPRVWQPLGDNVRTLDIRTQPGSPREIAAIAREMMITPA